MIEDVEFTRLSPRTVVGGALNDLGSYLPLLVSSATSSADESGAVAAAAFESCDSCDVRVSDSASTICRPPTPVSSALNVARWEPPQLPLTGEFDLVTASLEAIDGPSSEVKPKRRLFDGGGVSSPLFWYPTGLLGC